MAGVQVYLGGGFALCGGLGWLHQGLSAKDDGAQLDMERDPLALNVGIALVP